ncbi:hypothetical protein L0128_19475, partial [candidate division KSB1 bacterium]|nr:hypothetical protein [candidate division KSB1 bacterium]
KNVDSRQKHAGMTDNENLPLNVLHIYPHILSGYALFLPPSQLCCLKKSFEPLGHGRIYA